MNIRHRIAVATALLAAAGTAAAHPGHETADAVHPLLHVEWLLVAAVGVAALWRAGRVLSARVRRRRRKGDPD